MNRQNYKTVPISRQMVWAGYIEVRKKGKAAGVDGITLKKYEEDLGNNLYKLWNRLTSGSYFPSEVREVEIAKANGGIRKLGIPTISDKIAQTVVKREIEERLEKEFEESSYGYRPGRSAHEALNEVKKNVRKKSWVIDLY
jgi:RNA-directed DNA polymerase